MSAAVAAWSAKSLPSRLNQQLVPAQWPVEVREAVGLPPVGWDPATGWMEWETEDLTVCCQSLSVGTVLGSGSHRPYVFAVISTLAVRFGDDGVRLVVAFD